MKDWIISSLGGGATALAIIVAIIGLAGALGGAASSYIVAQKTVYVNAITAERMKWINLLRGNLASLVSNLTIVQIAKSDRTKVSDDSLIETLKKMNELAMAIELQLNIDGTIDKNIMKILNETYKATAVDYKGDLKRLMDALILHSRCLLKEEWERVKYEAMGWVGKANSKRRSFFRMRRYKKIVNIKNSKYGLDFIKST